MILFKKIKDLRTKLNQLRNEQKSIALIPTMGALHNGHISLIDSARKRNDITVTSIFVNPTQFNDINDFEKYPITIENDIFLLEKANNSILFLPSVQEMYPEGTEKPTEHYQLGNLENILEGFYRPGHFQGVCRVVHKLLNIVNPDDLYMGQKDYQQCMVIKKLIEDFQIPAKLHIVPTQREASGLAMSSRNLRLSEVARKNATAISKALEFIKNNIANQPMEELKATAQKIITDAGFQKIDYVEICNADNLLPAQDFNNQKLVALAAAFIDDVRLIDNMLLN